MSELLTTIKNNLIDFANNIETGGIVGGQPTNQIIRPSGADEALESEAHEKRKGLFIAPVFFSSIFIIFIIFSYLIYPLGKGYLESGNKMDNIRDAFKYAFGGALKGDTYENPETVEFILVLIMVLSTFIFNCAFINIGMTAYKGENAYYEEITQATPSNTFTKTECETVEKNTVASMFGGAIFLYIVCGAIALYAYSDQMDDNSIYFSGWVSAAPLGLVIYFSLLIAYLSTFYYHDEYHYKCDKYF